MKTKTKATAVALDWRLAREDTGYEQAAVLVLRSVAGAELKITWGRAPGRTTWGVPVFGITAYHPGALANLNAAVAPLLARADWEPASIISALDPGRRTIFDPRQCDKLVQISELPEGAGWRPLARNGEHALAIFMPAQDESSARLAIAAKATSRSQWSPATREAFAAWISESMPVEQFCEAPIVPTIEELLA